MVLPFVIRSDVNFLNICQQVKDTLHADFVCYSIYPSWSEAMFDVVLNFSFHTTCGNACVGHSQNPHCLPCRPDLCRGGDL